MKVVIIGSGNVATILGKLIIKSNHQIIQIISKEMAHAKILADELDCDYTDFEGQINLSANIYIAAILDGVLDELYKYFNLKTKLIVHTSGAMSKNILKDVSNNYGVLYPLQSLVKQFSYAPVIPFLIDGNCAETILQIETFAKTISPNVQFANDEKRQKLHVASVFVNNFTNHLYKLTEEFCKKEDVDFKMLLPLIEETTNRLKNYSPAKTQTGPAIRNDIISLEKHLYLLKNYPKLKYLYIKLTDSIINN